MIGWDWDAKFADVLAETVQNEISFGCANVNPTSTVISMAVARLIGTDIWVPVIWLIRSILKLMANFLWMTIENCIPWSPQGTPDGRIPGGATIFFKVQLLEVLTAGIGGSPKLFGADGRPAKASSGAQKGSGLLGADGRPL